MPRTFLETVNEYYLSSRNDSVKEELANEEVTWTGTVIDALSKSIVVYSGSNSPNLGWENQNSDTLPFIFFARFKRRPDSSLFKIGDPITIKGKIASLGNKQYPSHWKITDCEIIEVDRHDS